MFLEAEKYSVGQNPSDKEIEQMVLDVDVDGSGEIDFEVIASACASNVGEHVPVSASVCVCFADGSEFGLFYVCGCQY